MQGETIFRFYNLRPAAPVNSTTVQPFGLAGKKTNLLTEFESARGNSNDKLKSSCEQVLKKNLQPESIMVHQGFSCQSLTDWFNQNRFKTAKEALSSDL